MLCLQLNLFYRVLRARGGKLQACRAFLMCSISLCSACWLLQTTLALNAKSWKHYFLLWWSGYCPSVHIGQCVWTFCRQWWLDCCWDLEKPKCPRKVGFLLGLVPLWWTVYVGPVSWSVVVIVVCVLSPGWQRCHPCTIAKGGGCGEELRVLTSKSSINRLAMKGLIGEPMAAPWSCL